MIWGSTGLATAFVILSALFLWFLIKSKIKLSIRFIIIPVVVWYGLVLYHTPSKLMGFPLTVNSIEEIPNYSVVLYVKVVEPDYKSSGYIYFYVVHPYNKYKKDKNIIQVLNPKKIFGFDDRNVPISYKLDYDKFLHKDLEKQREKMKAMRGSVMRIVHGKGKMKDGQGRDENPDSEFEVLNPHKILPKVKKNS